MYNYCTDCTCKSQYHSRQRYELMQCEMFLGLDSESTKKSKNKKFSECISTIHYNVIHMYILFTLKFLRFLANPFTL